MKASARRGVDAGSSTAGGSRNGAVCGVVSPFGRRAWFSSWVERRAGTNPVVRAFLRLSSCAEQVIWGDQGFSDPRLFAFFIVREGVASPSSRLG